MFFLNSPMDPRDRRVLERVLGGLPLVEEPFACLADELEIDASEICNRINHLKENGILRQLGGVFSPSRLGYRSAIVAVAIPEHMADRTAGIINLHPNITHNALYKEEFNIWFALWSPPGHDPERDVEALLERAEATKHRVMHDLETYINGDKLSEPEAVEIDPGRRELIELLQRDLELIARPFRHLARSVQISERQLLDELIRMHEEKLIERYGGILRRQQPGVEEVRSLLALRVEKKHQARAARELSTHPAIRRAYVREMSDDLPYNVYANMSAPDSPTFDRVLAKLTGSDTVLDHKLFISLREYKSCRLKYFTGDYELWKESFLGEPIEG